MGRNKNKSTGAEVEHEKFVRVLALQGSELTAIANRLCNELPENCRDRCPMAAALQVAINEDKWSCPRTPPGSRFMNPRESGGHSTVSDSAELALRSVVRNANKQNGQGPRGIDGSVCCTDGRDIEQADYAKGSDWAVY